MEQFSQIDQVLNGLRASVILVDISKKILFANSAACVRFGEDIVGGSFIRVVRNPDCLRAIDAVLNGEKERNVEISIGASPSTTFEIHISNLGKSQKHVARAAITFEDVSQIRDAQLMRSEFVANVSHELRSPLTALAGFVETLRGSAKEDEGARDRFLGLMENEAGRMARLIDDLLSLSKLQGKERIRPAGSVDIHVLLQRVIATLTPIAEQEGAHIKFRNSCEINQIIGDEDELTQVFHNVIENAIKYSSSQSEVLIDMASRERVGGVDGQVVYISVKDEGPGIQPEDIPRLTERFYRADKSRSRIKGGTGLGLAIVKHILNRHRGRLQIESELGEGSTFTVFLPVR